MAAALRTTDAGDFAIGPAHTSVPSTKSTVQTTVAQSPIFGIPAKLEQFVLLAKSARGAGVANLIERATSAPGVYVFSELLDLPTIKDLAKNEQHSKYYELLEIFAFGTWADYTAKRDSLPKLNPAQETKLRHLTILSLAMVDRIIPYSLLLTSLELTSIPVLEDLLIEAFYSNVLSGRLDQKDLRLEVTTTTGRDVRSTIIKDDSLLIREGGEGDNAMEVDPTTTATTTGESSTTLSTNQTSHSISTLTNNLQDFLSNISTLLNSLEKHIAILQSDSINEITLKTEHDNLIKERVSEVIKLKEKESSNSNSNNNNNNNSGNYSGNNNSTGGNNLTSSFTGLGRKLAGSSNAAALGISSSLSNLLGGGNASEEMDIDSPAASSTTRGLRSPPANSNTSTTAGGTVTSTGRQKKRKV